MLSSISAPSQQQVLTLDVLRALDGAPLVAFLLERRWFGAKAGAPRSARIVELVPLPWNGGAFAIARVAVESDQAERHYQLPLALREGLAAPPSPAAPKAAIASITWPGGEGLLYDAVEDPSFRRALADAFAKPGGEEHRGARLRWVIEPIGAAPLVVPLSAELRVGSAEQSNTSIFFDDEAILKLFRRLETGEHPDLELTRFLTIDAHFVHTPTLLGAIRLVHDDGTVEVAGMLQEVVPGAKDAWAFALERGAPYFTVPKDREPSDTFAAEAERLGAITRDMHEALASDEDREAFAPEPATSDDVRRWADDTRGWIERSLALLGRQLDAKALPKERMGEAQVLFSRREHYLAWVEEIVESVGDDAGFRIRIHGDYHLGQVLRTKSDDFMIIDFEGEPARPLEERREKASPLRDVAGMLRSFAYAASMLSMRIEKTHDLPTREVRAGRWERSARDAFLRGYAQGAEGESGAHHAPGSEHDEPGILPEEPENVRRLLALFETEKAFYELAYELNNRPAWAWIPMRGISKLLVRA